MNVSVPPVEYIFIPKLFSLLTKARDEAHRFALRASRQSLRKSSKSSIFMKINGIGPKKSAKLIKHFKSLDGVRSSTIDQIAKVACISQNQAIELLDLIS